MSNIKLNKSRILDIRHWILDIGYSKGFTLVEILVAITIIATISILAIPNLRKFGEDQKLSDTSGDLIRILKEAQSSSMSGITCSGVPSIGWEVQSNGASYSLVCKSANAPETIYTKPILDVTVKCSGNSSFTIKRLGKHAR